MVVIFIRFTLFSYLVSNLEMLLNSVCRLQARVSFCMCGFGILL